MFTESIEFLELQDLKESLQGLDPSNTLILCDTNTARHCLPLLELEDFKQCILPAGEENKSLSHCETVWNALLEHQVDRNGTVINLGGGVITDLGAFAASVYKRGIAFIHVPTSYMGMVDAAIGGKTALNFGGIKNPLGTFGAPEEVLIYEGFLHSLPEIEAINGFAESIKHALIKSAVLWEQIKKEEAFSLEFATSILKQSVEIKGEVVDEDPFEMGERKSLNFGHTIGHAVEAHFMGDNSIRHGESIAIGMYCEAYLSEKEHYLTSGQVEEIKLVLNKFYPKKEIKALDLSPIMEKIKNDKKNSSQGYNFTLLDSIGSAISDQYIEEPLIQESIEAYINTY